MSEEVERIAKGLDRPRRRALFSETEKGNYNSKTLRILTEQGLIDDHWYITPLGQAVRDYLGGGK